MNLPTTCPLAGMLLLLPSLAVAQTDRSDRDHLWADAMAAFAAEDAKQPPVADQVVFVGSSSIRLWDLGESFPDLSPPPRNRGFGGSHLEDTLRHLELLVLKHRPRVVVVYAGDNDIAAGKSVERVVGDFQQLAEQIRTSLPETRIVYIAIKPSIARWNLAEKMREANRRIAAACEEDPRLKFVDVWQPMLGEDGEPRPELFADDGLHLNAQGYRLWTSLVAPELQDETTGQ